MKLVVYSCVTGSYDNARKTLFKSRAKAEKDTRYVLFTDAFLPKRVKATDTYWDVKPLVWRHKRCPVRTSRWHKINSHILFPEADYTVWIDGSLTIKSIAVASELVLRYLGDRPLATFRHPQRNCVYEEAAVCMQLKRDQEATIVRQMNTYRGDSYPLFHGLVETACLIRKTTPEITRFNEAWWKEMDLHSFRDQLSFNYVSWKSGLTYAVIPGQRDKSSFFIHSLHKEKLFKRVAKHILMPLVGPELKAIYVWRKTFKRLPELP